MEETGLPQVKNPAGGFVFRMPFVNSKVGKSRFLDMILDFWS